MTRLSAFRAKDTLAVLLTAVLLLALSTTFAIELANTQARNRADERTRVHQRAVLAAALIDGLFGTVTQDTAQDTKRYGGATVSTSVLDRAKQTNRYLAVTNANGTVLAASSGFTPQLASLLPSDEAMMAVRHGALYGLGNVVSTAQGPVLDFITTFPTAYGKRFLVSSLSSSALRTFLQGDLSKIPGVKGEVNYVIDGNGHVLAATSRAASSAPFSGPHPTDNAVNFSRNVGGRYYDEVKLTNSQWRIVLASPDGPLYASVSGLNKWLPWIIFLAFAVVAVFAFGLLGRVLKAVGQTREANEQLESLNRQLEDSNQLLEKRAAELARSNEELEQFASIASHDLQEPLRKVRTFTEELTRIEGDSLSEKGRDYLGRANAAAERMQTLIEDLLKFSRVTTHPAAFSPVDLEKAAEEVLDDLAYPIERTGAIVHVGRLPTIGGDPLQMRQLLQNLLSNALKFHGPNRSPEVWLDAVVARDTVQLTVRDNGIGFDQRYAGRIFRVFERLHGRNEFPGTGIGLALCRKIVERHGGTIAATSEAGVGTTFTVTLPLRQAGTKPHRDDLNRAEPDRAGAHV